MNNKEKKQIQMKTELKNYYNNIINILLLEEKIQEKKEYENTRIETLFETKINTNNEIKAIYKKEIIKNNETTINSKNIYFVKLNIEITNNSDKIKNAILIEPANDKNYIIVNKISINIKYINNGKTIMNNCENIEEILNNKKIFQIIKNANEELSYYNYAINKQKKKSIKPINYQ